MKFPHPCGDELQWRILHGEDPTAIIPDEYYVTKGGIAPVPDCGTVFSCTVGPSLGDAACALPYGQIRWTTAGAIRAGGGLVIWIAEKSRHQTTNLQHANIVEGVSTTFSDPIANPVPKRDRIDGDK